MGEVARGPAWPGPGVTEALDTGEEGGEDPANVLGFHRLALVR